MSAFGVFKSPFLFVSTDKLAELTADLERLQPIVILRLLDMMAIDATGLHASETLLKQLKQSGKCLLLCGANQQSGQTIKNSALLEQLGRENMHPILALH
jgi:SulP family sulfate permease